MKNNPAKLLPCTRSGCVALQHARQVCRKHYYALRCEEDEGFRERMLERRRKHYSENKRAARGYHFRKKYGISLEDYDRMLGEQDGRCAICRRESDKHLVVDHDHESGAVRALLCSSCNMAVGFVREDPVIAEQIIFYLTHFGKLGEDLP